MPGLTNLSRFHDHRRSGLLLVGHGTRNARGKDEFFELSRLIAQRWSSAVIEPCFLELAEPTIAQAVLRLAEADVRQVVVAGVLLFSAGHARYDIPQAVAAAAATYGPFELLYADPLDCHQAVLELSAIRFRQAVGLDVDEARQSAALVIVGRGGSDPDAAGSMRRFVGLRRGLTPVAHATSCFLAKAEPSLEASLAEAATMKPVGETRQIVVQPHLLFWGDLLDRVNREVESAAIKWPQWRWTVAAHLGPDRLIADALLDRIQAAQGAA